MAEQKTILEWLEQAKSEGYEWADAAIERVNIDRPFTGNAQAFSLSDALNGGFVWPDSEFDFWQSLVKDLEEQGK